VPSGRSGTGMVGFRFRNFFHPLSLKSSTGNDRLIFIPWKNCDRKGYEYRTDLGIKPA
jgi:hypothetical protein